MSVKKTIVQRQTPAQAVNFVSNIHPVLQRVYLNRNITDENQLEKSLTKLLSFHALKNIDLAVNAIVQCLKKNETIVIIGDFDADGATSTAVAIKSLKWFGAAHVEYLVPNRFDYGYGLTPEIVKEAQKRFQPNLIITVDNGISSIEGVECANELGIQVVITDHHLAGDQLPSTEAIVNPNQPGDLFESKSMAGVGVIFYVMLALRSKLREENWFDEKQIQIPNLSVLLDLIALGTVADVVPLDFNNRILVNQGLKRIRAGQCCEGIKALIEVSNRNPLTLVAGDMGFSLGPRINAAGRLEDMSIGIRLLLSDNPVEAKQIATELNSLNMERREIESQMQMDAMAVLNAIHFDSENDIPNGITLFDSGWHQGVVGILASRVKEKFHRPTIVFAENDDGEIKGSARSIPNLHIRDVLDHIATQNPGLIIKFGGHAMAAGLTIEKQNLENFEQRFNDTVTQFLKPDQLEKLIYSDGNLSNEDYNLRLADLLKNAEPWGQEFPEPMFDGIFKLTQQRVVGEKHLKMRLVPENSQQEIDAIAFNAIEATDATTPYNIGDQLHAAFKLDVNEFRGRKSVQLIVEYLE